MDFQIKEIYPSIFHLHFDTRWNAAMHFLRFQEYYESPKFAGKIVPLVEYMGWYQKNHDDPNKFSYPYDWSGFNIPSWVMDEVFAAGIPDLNPHDELMLAIYKAIKMDHDVFYLVGTSEECGTDGGWLDHEVAHGLWATNPQYKDDMLSLLAKLQAIDWEAYKEATGALSEAGYHKKVRQDEIQAYCSTGPSKWLEKILIPDLCGPFVTKFQQWKKKLDEKGIVDKESE